MKTNKRDNHYIVQADKVMPNGIIKCLRPHCFRSYLEAVTFARFYAAIMLLDDTIKDINVSSAGWVLLDCGYQPMFAIYNPKYYNTL